MANKPLNIHWISFNQSVNFKFYSRSKKKSKINQSSKKPPIHQVHKGKQPHKFHISVYWHETDGKLRFQLKEKILFFQFPIAINFKKKHKNEYEELQQHVILNEGSKSR